jgi:hypothetical protein
MKKISTKLLLGTIILTVLTILFPLEQAESSTMIIALKSILFTAWFISLWLTVFAKTLNEEFLILANKYLRVEDADHDGVDIKMNLIVFGISLFATALFLISFLFIENLVFLVIAIFVSAACSLVFNLLVACNLPSFKINESSKTLKMLWRFFILTSIVPLSVFSFLMTMEYSHLFSMFIIVINAGISYYLLSDKISEMTYGLEGKYHPRSQRHSSYL